MRAFHRTAWDSCLVVAALAMFFAIHPATATECRPVPSERFDARDFSKGLLWKIEHQGSEPSHLFGTFHSSDPHIVTLPCPVQRVFDRSASYSMEMLMNGAGIIAMAQAMYLDGDKTLKDVVGESVYRDTQSALENAGVGTVEQFSRKKPWVVMLALSDSPQKGGLFLDLALQYDATRRGIPTYGLETMAEQVAVFNGMSLEDQTLLLRDAIQHQGHMSKAMTELVDAYLRRDIDGLMQLSEKYKATDARVNSVLMDRLLVQRNKNMAERMQGRLKEGNAFIAVGALHLPGESGLLRLLTQAGYRVSRVY
ncbi:MAG: TraB/GumN family protein [Gammaproteobacteria bacterium]|nr:TraB/GumN family protein [Gammaproteobacteria bacterium]